MVRRKSTVSDSSHVGASSNRLLNASCFSSFVRIIILIFRIAFIVSVFSFYYFCFRPKALSVSVCVGLWLFSLRRNISRQDRPHPRDKPSQLNPGVVHRLAGGHDQFRTPAARPTGRLAGRGPCGACPGIRKTG
jgi:hypothetical protein